MKFSAVQIAEATGGRLHGADVMCDGASIDTREIERDMLFVPIEAARDGHDFIPEAVHSGAAAYLTHHEPRPDVDGATAIVVEDTLAALGRLGHAARQRHQGPVIGITGSVGKTSVKDLAAAAIGVDLRVHASARSFNNELGVPLTLVNAPEDTEVLIVEMGARGIGHIDDLCAIAQPTIGIVTWVGAVHTSEFGTVAAVAKAKAELVQALPPTGTAILNIDSPEVADMESLSFAPVVTYGAGGRLRAVGITTDDELLPSFTAIVDDDRFSVWLPVSGEHQVSNALAAIAAARAVGVPVDRAVIGLERAQLSPWRMEVRRSVAGARIINDAYNANAISTAAALRSLASLDADRRVAVLGVMAELGDRHDDDHQAMAALAIELGIDAVAFDEPAYGLPIVTDIDAAVDAVGDLDDRTAVLVKGSRVAGLERLAARLVDGSASPAAGV